MQKLRNSSAGEIENISQQIADAFYDYKYNEEDMGLLKYIRSREDMYTYIGAIVRAAYKSGLMYTTSDKREGYLIVSGETVGSIGIADGIKMIIAEKKALGGWRKLKDFVSACFSDGGSLETRMRKAKRKFIRIEVLVVRPEYQRHGYMRKILQTVYNMADKKHLPVILDTDDKNKCMRYQHLGMTIDKIRNCGEKLHMYDLIREPRNSQADL
ncbi:GNAT family N-acetyltransferase [uncultured Ruminococcus sp.]|uniref:GNAT family N-acetyltransferase n=1 Tax=uncultured Ruminococcus sp. TaxID=165186 RepID=UPI0025CC5B81|nr:GNAT family N-acetyltransferase [uncultured Ruminococcus sp.]